MFIQRSVSRISPQNFLIARMYSEGSIRAAGGAFGKLEAAREEEYFRKKQFEAIQKLRSNSISQADYHEMRIKEHEAAIERHKEFLKSMSEKADVN